MNIKTLKPALNFLLSLTLLYTLSGLLLIKENVARAVVIMTGDQLYSYCHHNKDNPNNHDGIRCITYIQGFLDGAIATDEGVAENVIS